jgi:hypothetical protein
VLWELIVLAKDNKSDAVDLVRNTFISYIATTHTNAPPMSSSTFSHHTTPTKSTVVATSQFTSLQLD